ncbi:hypothetical protein BOTBODRAFT_121859 [Botryobasidium botryosum FD-172 SS1]|uniref:Uncharacterized protein n=1 Tax=Botryobasidium botryosum (strain FD-172 SS1) TaxID=930990 RepID=A0A067LV46_BOTB1|nr:hypothetical protein BOTBODRAFT_121859 [Botryobasidium botryosum FD-172 SS1]
MLMHMKGHNGKSPCRTCRIDGILDPRPRSTAHYTPLHRHPHTHSYDPFDLPNRTHDEFMQHAASVDDAPTDAEANRRATHFGINGMPALAMLSSLKFPASFPHDFMHLMFENIIPELISLWTTDYKGLDTGKEAYRLRDSVWSAIGEACAASGDTIPAAFGCRVPNVAKKGTKHTAESRLLFTTLIAPVLLFKRFNNDKYYKHFIKLVKLINLCLQLELRPGDVASIRSGFAKWVKDFERSVLPLKQYLRAYQT